MAKPLWQKMNKVFACHFDRLRHTQHTTNKVPLIYLGRPASLAQDGALSDLAPTLLHLMGVAQPVEMTGKNLVHFLP